MVPTILFRNHTSVHFCQVKGASSPKYPRGNGLADRTVGTVKAMIRKAWLAGDDPHLALLAYRSTEHESTGVSPGQLLMGRKLRTTLPMISSQLFLQLVDDSLVEERDRISKLKQAEYYNQRNGVRPLTELQFGDRVLVYDKKNKEWNRSGAFGTKVQPSSYQIKTESGRVIRGNRSDIRPHPQLEEQDAGYLESDEDQEETPAQDLEKQQPEMADESSEIRTRSGRVVRPP